MQVLRSVAELREWRATVGTIGFVPTMGALHEGHRSLMTRALEQCGTGLVSIFVNPTQFAPNEDWSAYPRPEAADIALLERTGIAAAYLPAVHEMYPPGDDTRVIPGAIASRLEGAARPGHFAGVATVVTKLLAMARPDVAFFGQKDFQQLRVIQQMSRDLALGPRIVGCPIVRDHDGLALSSRNAYLGPEERRRALALSRGLFAARDLWNSGRHEPRQLRELVEEHLKEAGAPDYVSVADPFTLEELDRPADRAVISLAIRVGRARLIDNLLLGMDVAELI